MPKKRLENLEDVVSYGERQIRSVLQGVRWTRERMHDGLKGNEQASDAVKAACLDEDRRLEGLERYASSALMSLPDDKIDRVLALLKAFQAIGFLVED